MLRDFPPTKLDSEIISLYVQALMYKSTNQFLLRDKLITEGEKRETSTKTCNETMLRDKLGVFASRISPPLVALAAFLARRQY